MNDIQFWALILSVMVAVGGLMAAVFYIGRFAGRMERGMSGLGEQIADLKAKVDTTAETSAAAHKELREALMNHLQASIPAVSGD